MEAVVGGLRQAALLVHCLHPSDAAWLLARLDAVQRTRIQKLVKELRSLGIPAQPELAKPLPPIQDELSAVQMLVAVPAHTVVEILYGEPAQLVAHIMLMGDQRWRLTILEAFGQRRREIESFLPCVKPLAPRLRETLLAQFLAVVAERRDVIAAAGRHSRPRWWPGMTARWLRRDAEARS